MFVLSVSVTGACHIHSTEAFGSEADSKIGSIELPGLSFVSMSPGPAPYTIATFVAEAKVVRVLLS